MTIEDFLGLSREQIEKRKTELRNRIPTSPGTEYLKSRAKIFDVQPWPFINYLAHRNTSTIRKALEMYKAYAGANESEAIMEQLREVYINYSLQQDILKEMRADKK